MKNEETRFFGAFVIHHSELMVVVGEIY